PQRLDAQVHKIREPLENALKVADAVAVGVLKRAGINLIEDGALPPRRPILLPCPVCGDDLNHKRPGFTFGAVAAFGLVASSTAGGGVGLPPRQPDAITGR